MVCRDLGDWWEGGAGCRAGRAGAREGHCDRGREEYLGSRGLYRAAMAAANTSRLVNLQTFV